MESKNIVPAQPGDIVIYQSGAGLPEVECTFHGDNMWLTQAQMTRKPWDTISQMGNNAAEGILAERIQP